MLATFGLQRLESSLADCDASAAEVEKLLSQARPAESMAQNPAIEARSIGPHWHAPHDRRTAADRLTLDLDGPDLPTRQYVHHRPNPEFQPTRQANRV